MGNGIRLKVTPLQGELISEGTKKDANLPPFQGQPSFSSSSTNHTYFGLGFRMLLSRHFCYRIQLDGTAAFVSFNCAHMAIGS